MLRKRQKSCRASCRNTAGKLPPAIAVPLFRPKFPVSALDGVPCMHPVLRLFLRLLLLCLIEVFAFCASAQAADWLTVASDRVRRVELGRASIMPSEAGTKVAWGRIVLSNDQAKAYGYRTVRALNRYDCRSHSFMIVKRVYLSDDESTLREDRIDASTPPIPPSRPAPWTTVSSTKSASPRHWPICAIRPKRLPTASPDSTNRARTRTGQSRISHCCGAPISSSTPTNPLSRQAPQSKRKRRTGRLPDRRRKRPNPWRSRNFTPKNRRARRPNPALSPHIPAVDKPTDKHLPVEHLASSSAAPALLAGPHPPRRGTSLGHTTRSRSAEQRSAQRRTRPSKLRQ